MGDLNTHIDAGRKLHSEFTDGIANLQKNHLVDFRVSIQTGPETTTGGVIGVINHLLELRRRGKVCPLSPDICN